MAKQKQQRNTNRRRLLIGVIGLGLFLVVGIFARVWLSQYGRNQSTNYRKATFSQSYLTKNSGKVLYSVPESVELLYVLLSLGEFGQSPDNIEMEGEYYTEVKNHFRHFADHPAVAQVNEAVNRWGISNLGVILSYEVTSETSQEVSLVRLVGDGLHSPGGLFERVIAGQEEIEDFAKVSDFRQFFQNHQTFYEEEISRFAQTVPVELMWQWLEKNFEQRHEIYRVHLSPLRSATQYTYLFRDNENKVSEIVMHVPVLSRRIEEQLAAGYLTNELAECYQSLLLFTEIDHNYVNPTTDKFRNRLRVGKVFSNRAIWATTKYYTTPTHLFNEYLTWALFPLFVEDTYGQEVAETVASSVNSQMLRRGFPMFSQFQQEVTRLYRERKEGERICDLYPPILDACEQLVSSL